MVNPFVSFASFVVITFVSFVVKSTLAKGTFFFPRSGDFSLAD